MMPRRWILAWAGWAGALVCGSAFGVATNDPSLLSAITMGQLEPKPAYFESFTDRLDYLHRNVPLRLNAPIAEVDEYYAAGLDQAVARPPSRFRMGLFIEGIEDEGFELDFEPEFDAEVEMPNLERRMHVFIETEDVGALAGESPGSGDDSAHLGARTYFDALNVNLDAGVRIDWPPELFARATWRRNLLWQSLHVTPEQRLYYETDDGAGEVTSLALGRWFGAQRRWGARSISSLKWTVEEEDFEWRETVKFGYVKKLIDERARGRNVDAEDVAKGTGLRYSLHGEDSEFRGHEIWLIHRRPLYKNWLYLEISPGFEWDVRDDDDDDPAPVEGEPAAEPDEDERTIYHLRVGFDAVFWEVQ